MTLHINLKDGAAMEINRVRFVSTYLHTVFTSIPEIVIHFEDDVMMPQMNIPLADIDNYWIAR